MLVVEDNDEVRARRARQLLGLGYRVEAVDDGRRPLDSPEARRRLVDLLFTDS